MLLELAIFGVGILMIVLSVLVYRGNRRVAWAGVIFSAIYASTAWLPQSDRGLLINALVSALFAIPAVYLMLSLLTEKPISPAAQRGHSSSAAEPVPRDPR